MLLTLIISRNALIQKNFYLDLFIVMPQANKIIIFQIYSHKNYINQFYYDYKIIFFAMERFQSDIKVYLILKNTLTMI